MCCTRSATICTTSRKSSTWVREIPYEESSPAKIPSIASPSAASKLSSGTPLLYLRSVTVRPSSRSIGGKIASPVRRCFSASAPPP